MPHLTLEHTANIKQDIDTVTIFYGLHQILSTTGGINIENCKSRTVRLDNFYIGRAVKSNAFVHLDISFMEGKPAELQQAIGEQCLSLLMEYFGPSLSKHKLQITVAIIEIQKSAYFKYPGGTLS